LPTLIAAVGLALVVGVLVARELPMRAGQSPQGAWTVVAGTPSVAALPLDEGRLRGVARPGGTAVFVPDRGDGFVLLLVRVSRIIALEHWTFGRSREIGVTNLLAGRQARFASAGFGRDAYASLAVIADARLRYATVNDLPVSVPRACLACDQALEEVRGADRTLLDAQYAVARTVFERVQGCRDAAPCSDPSADLEATLSGAVGRARLDALFEAQARREVLVEALRSCQTLVPTACDGGLYVYTNDAEMVPVRDGYALGTVGVINRAQYSRLVALHFDGATLPLAEVILPGRGESRVQVGSRCSVKGVQRVTLEVRDAAPTARVAAADRRADAVASFICTAEGR
jgi:hypothetical protein